MKEFTATTFLYDINYEKDVNSDGMIMKVLKSQQQRKIIHVLAEIEALWLSSQKMFVLLDQRIQDG